jgi:hypothetical protein
MPSPYVGIEQSVEPCLEHIEFGIGDWYTPRLIVSVYVSTSCLGERPMRGQGSGSM